MIKFIGSFLLKKYQNMKKQLIPFSLLVIMMFLFNFSVAQVEDHNTIIEESLAIEKLQEYFATDEMGKIVPMIIVTNGHFSEYLDLDHNGKKIELYQKKQDMDLIYDEAFVNVKKFKIRGNVSILKFRYQKKKVKVKLYKKDGKWKYLSLTVKGDGDYYKHFDREM